MLSKETVRRRLLEMRDLLDPSEVRRLSGCISGRLLGSRMIEAAVSVALYSQVRNEVRTDLIFEGLRKRGKSVLFPRVVGERLEFVEAQDLSDLKRGNWSALEPRGGQVMEVKEIEMVVLPGAAFDIQGNRLGFGRGCYDRVLRTYSGVKVGLAYEFQVLKVVPHNEADIVCDWICTENRLIRIGH